MADSPRTLAQALDFKLSQVLRYDLFVGLLGGGGSVWIAVTNPTRVNDVLPLASALVGVVIGAVLAGVAVLAAFLNQPFLRKLKAINREPVRYIRPFVFTAVIGVVASLLMLVLAALPASTPTWGIAVAAGLAGFTTSWTIASVLPGMSMLVQFIGLQFDAADVPDDFESHLSGEAPTPPQRV